MDELFERSPLPMWTYDRTTLRFVAVNEAAIRHYGYSRDEFLAMTLADIRPAADHPALVRDVEAATGLGDGAVWTHRKKDGSLIEVEIKANDFTAGGLPLRLVLAHDVTARLRAERALEKTREQLRQVQKMDALGQLAGGIAHDFNNLLAVITTYSSMLEDSIPVSDERHADAVEIRRAAERGTAITRQLLTVSRHGLVEPRAVELHELVGGFLAMLSRLVGERVTIVPQLAAVPAVIADPGQLEQVLMNLAVNARDAMPTGGKLTFETAVVELDEARAVSHQVEPGAYVVLAVTDSGAGMDADTQRRIFEPFFTTKGVGRGTGLGLSIVHGIVAQAGGAIAVYSELGHGTTFRIHLPVAKHLVEAVAREAPPDVRELPPSTVLVVDDMPAVRGAAERILREAGCKVLEAATAEEARRVCVAHDGAVDVVLLDVVLPDARGDVLIGELRELRPDLRGVLMSGYPAGALTPQGGTPPALLVKPFNPRELRAAIGHALDAGSRPSEPRTTPTRAHVLIADDDPYVRRALARILKRAELDVVEVDTGAKAIDEIGRHRFDVILSDIHMPDGSGLDLMRAVRRTDLDVPVILISGEPDVSSAAAAVEYGAFRYLTKPFDHDAIVRLVNVAWRAHALAKLRREALSINGVTPGAVDRVGLEVRFDQALEGMWMVFQPIVDAKTGALFGVEALMRSGESSMPSPPAILDAATQLQRVSQLGRRTRRLSASALTERPDIPSLFVNLHPEDLLDPELVEAGSPLASIASRVVLEVTERSALASSPELTARIEQLRALGYRLAIDDIGAGYSGLTSFTELMPEVVKIDMALVRDVHVSALKQRTIAALCKLCHEVGVIVVGEGVETLDERDCLVSLGCDLLQGFLIARPHKNLP